MNGTDPEIKITIRTPTSTRPALDPIPEHIPEHNPEYKQDNDHIDAIIRRRRESRREPRNRRTTSPDLINIEYSIVPIMLDSSYMNVDPQSSYFDSIFNYILNRSFEEKHELTKNPEIKLDLHTRETTNKDTSETCPICMNTFKLNEQVSTLSCNHTIHTVCITEWGYYKQECPLCRVPIKVLEE